MTQHTHRSARELDDLGWARLTESVEQFEANWNTTPCPDPGDFVPSVDTSIQQRILTELIKVDMDYRWRSGRQKPLENYLQEWPQLDREATADLLESECLVRFFAGEPATPEELASRFPQLAPQIRLDDLHREFSEDSAAQRDTSPTALHTQSTYLAEGCVCLAPGQSFGRYRILELLGTGSMGSVYRAYDPNLDRLVALKIPHSNDPAIIDRFLREAQLAARIRHPNVCPIYDADRIHGVPYLTMALIDGPTLAQEMKERRWPPHESAQLVTRIAQALQSVHDQGIVHRDVKPANVMLDADGQPLLMDFGLAGGGRQQQVARDLSHAHDLPVATVSATSPVIGTPAYMAPEQVQGHEASQRSDIYGLGVVFYQLLTGALPYRGSVEEVLEQVVHKSPLAPREHDAEIPDALERVCLRAMAKDPAQRYPTARAMAEDLDRCLRRRPSRARRILLTAAALLLLGVLATVIYFQTGSGTLELEVPSGATVVIDGANQPLDAGRVEATLRVGKHRLQVFLNKAAIADQPITIRWRGDKVAGFVASPPTVTTTAWTRTAYDLHRTYHQPVATQVKTTNQLERVAWEPAQATESVVCIRTGDLQGDGRLEIVVRAGKEVIAYDETGNELWRQTPIDDAKIELLSDHQDLAANIELVDFDQDGAMEVLTLASTNPLEQWLRSSTVKTVVYNSSGSQVDCISVFEQVAKAHGKPAGCFDFNGDGLPDIVLAVAVWKHPHGVFVYDVATQKELFSTLFADQPNVCGVGDVDGDGQLELYLCQEWDSHVDEPVGEYTSEHCYATLFELSGERLWVQEYDDSLDGFLADLDGDGTLDILLFNSTEQGGTLYVLDPKTGKWRSKLGGFGNALCRRWSMADLNHDGRPELVLGDGQHVHVVGFTEELEPRVNQQLELSDTRVAATNDLNGDGQMEIAAYQDANLIVLDHQLKEIARYVSSGPIHDAIISDINLDGINELLLLAGPAGKVKVQIVRFSPDRRPPSNTALPKTVALAFLRAVQRKDVEAAVEFAAPQRRQSIREAIQNLDLTAPSDETRVNIFHQRQGQAQVTIHAGQQTRLELELERRDGRWWVRSID